MKREEKSVKGRTLLKEKDKWLNTFKFKINYLGFEDQTIMRKRTLI